MIFRDIINRIVTEGAGSNVTTSAFLAHEIRIFRQSKKFKMMLDGVNYYEGLHDILNKKRTAVGVGGKLEIIENLPNAKQIDNQYKKMVKQKTNYLVGKPFSVQCENDSYVDLLMQFFNKQFFKQLKSVTKDALNCGIGWIYLHYTESGELCLKRFRPFEIIPGWSDVDHTQLEYVIRVYEVNAFDGRKEEKITKVEYYTRNGIDYFEYHSGQMVSCAPYHENYFAIEDETYNWEKIPFIPFRYNDEELPLIANCKSLQDGLNTILSNFQDNMQEDMRNTILVLVNYDGENLGEFRQNLATYGAVKVRTVEGKEGDVRTLQIEVNAENYKAIIEIFKKAIIENCMGFDAKDERMSGTPNQMNIQSMYNDIDLDAADVETEFQAAMEELLYFINLHLANTGQGDFEGENVEIVFNTDMPMDESTTIQNISGSEGILSKETLVANHPWVSDPQKELELLEKEQQKQMEQYAGAFGSINEPGGDGGEE
ncbi:phage portal protein [Emergencia sp. JLR.KK010]|uniref:phage portal protein n=1 Tax=Emergencia sp. JLR.KK010 TaxID=3114296 RepID=UPI0030D1D820